MKTTTILLLLGLTAALTGSAKADWVTSGNNMYSDVSGNVGIGTTDPTRKLSVVANGGDGVAVIGDDGDVSALLGAAGGNWGFLQLHGREGMGDVWIAPAGSYFEGSVGIGTKNPDDMLTVIGSISEPDDRGIYGYGSTGIYGEGYHRNIFGSESGTGVRGRGFSAGVGGTAWGRAGKGASGRATDTGHDINYGGYFVSDGWNGVGVYGEAAAPSVINGDSPQTYGGHFMARSELGYGVYGKGGKRGVFGEGHVGVYGHTERGDGQAVYGRHAESGNYGSLGNRVDGVIGHSHNRWGRGVYGTASGEYGFGVRGDGNGPLGRGVYGKGTDYDFYAGGANTNYGPFTGAHEVKLCDAFPTDVRRGMIVSVTGQTAMRYDAEELYISSTMPTVRLADAPYDKCVLGAFLRESSLPEDHWYAPTNAERFATVNALGEGRIWVCDMNGEIEAGDYITTSWVPGYGQRQDDDLLRSCTVAKAIETVDWPSVTETVEFGGQTYRVYLVAVVYVSG